MCLCGFFRQLLLFCEGTRFTEAKHAASMEVARQKGLPLLKHHLLPRTKGFVHSVNGLKGKGIDCFLLWSWRKTVVENNTRAYDQSVTISIRYLHIELCVFIHHCTAFYTIGYYKWSISNCTGIKLTSFIWRSTWLVAATQGTES